MVGFSLKNLIRLAHGFSPKARKLVFFLHSFLFKYMIKVGQVKESLAWQPKGVTPLKVIVKRLGHFMILIFVLWLRFIVNRDQIAIKKCNKK